MGKCYIAAAAAVLTSSAATKNGTCAATGVAELAFWPNTKVDELELEELGLERPNEAVNELEEDAAAKGFEANGFEAKGAAKLANILPPDDAEKAVNELEEDAAAKGFEANGFEAKGAAKLANILPPNDAEKAVNELEEDAAAKGFEANGFEAKLANMFPDDAEAAKNELDEADATANAFELHTNELLEIKTLNGRGCISISEGEWK